MTNTLSNETTAESASADAEVRTLRDRIERNPRPALLWLAGAAVLFVLEFGRVLGGLLALGKAGRFVLEGIASIPGWIGGNVGDALGTVIGAVVSDVVSLSILFIAAIVLQSYLPWRIDDFVDVDRSPKSKAWLERLVLTAILAVIAVLMAFTPIGGLVKAEVSLWGSVLDSLSSLPTLTSRETIPNMGHRTPEGGWEGTFLGLSPKYAWAIRFALVWVYMITCLVWVWKGFNVYREHYREADWTPRDDTIRRFRNHTWGIFGLIIVIGFVTLGVFAPAISPVPAEHNIYEPYNHEFSYLNDEGEVDQILHGTANLDSRSNGQNTVGLWEYDDYDRFAPLGTTPDGQDMLTHLAFGARTSLVISLSSVALGGLIAVGLSLMTAYYKGALDIVTIVVSDTIISIPVLVLVLMILVVFQNHPLREPMDGGLLLSLVLALAYWPAMWRAIRGPSLQVSEEEWVDAAKSYGQTPNNIMRKHMAPYIASYIIIYASLLIGGVIISVAALSFLGLGIQSPTPEWGRLISDGRPFIPTSSWHVSTISGILIALVVLAFNALGDAVRDAVDPEADIGNEGAGAGGGG
ncbi:ABC transporter permease [Halosolutus gelatinilyticus]|uniref:ABC transporter permease n=1 Tax=Halosolutus gelatinilyticus TaxID=2931975 RepID=UPI001FF50CB7|nr:ABC transporter permease [Halosolutus gelatinilyticus]